MLVIDYLKEITSLRKAGYPAKHMPSFVRRAARNVAKGQPWRFKNAPGSIVEVPEPGYDPSLGEPPEMSKYLITKRGKLCLI